MTDMSDPTGDGGVMRETPVRPLRRVEIDRAQRIIAATAKDRADAERVMDALGIHPANVEVLTEDDPRFTSRGKQ